MLTAPHGPHEVGKRCHQQHRTRKLPRTPAICARASQQTSNAQNWALREPRCTRAGASLRARKDSWIALGDPGVCAHCWGQACGVGQSGPGARSVPVAYFRARVCGVVHACGDRQASSWPPHRHPSAGAELCVAATVRTCSRAADLRPFAPPAAGARPPRGPRPPFRADGVRCGSQASRARAGALHGTRPASSRSALELCLRRPTWPGRPA